MPIYSLFVILTLYRLGQRWVGAKSQNRWRKATWAITWVADLSFGIYLIHPAVLEEITTRFVWMVGPFTRLIVTPVTALLTLAVSALIIRGMAATPWAVYAIGREQIPIPWDRWRRHWPHRRRPVAPADHVALEGAEAPAVAEGGAR